MATPDVNEYVELVGTSTTLLIGSKAIRLTDAGDLVGVGPSRGSNVTVGAAGGRLARDRSRDELAATVTLQINGNFDQDGAGVADPVANGLTLQRLVAGWPDTEDRAFTVRLTQYADVFEAAARFEEFGSWQRPDEFLWNVSFLLTVPDGVLTAVP